MFFNINAIANINYFVSYILNPYTAKALVRHVLEMSVGGKSKEMDDLLQNFSKTRWQKFKGLVARLKRRGSEITAAQTDSQEDSMSSIHTMFSDSSDVICQILRSTTSRPSYSTPHS